MKKYIAALALGLLLAGCTSDADVASANLSKAADQFEISRRVVFFNGITDTYLLEIQGLCSLGNFDDERELSVTCKVGVDDDGKGLYKKHFLGLSDNVSYFVEQIDAENVDTYHYRVIFRPEVIIPDVDLETSLDDK